MRPLETWRTIIKQFFQSSASSRWQPRRWPWIKDGSNTMGNAGLRNRLSWPFLWLALSNLDIGFSPFIWGGSECCTESEGVRSLSVHSLVLWGAQTNMTSTNMSIKVYLCRAPAQPQKKCISHKTEKELKKPLCSILIVPFTHLCSWSYSLATLIWIPGQIKSYKKLCSKKYANFHRLFLPFGSFSQPVPLLLH